MSFDWSGSFASRVSRFQGSAVREMFHWATLPGMISLSAGSPAPELFPVEEFRRAVNQVLDEEPVGALQYGITEGYEPLREWIARHLKSKGFSVSADEVLITTGSQQAMDLLVRILVDKGDVAVVERPTFIATLQALDTCEAEFLSAPMDEQGMIVDQLAKRLDGVRPKLICAQPNFQNPSGVSMSLPRRMQLAHLAVERGIPIVEDDPLLEKMAVVKQSNDLHTDGLVQRVVNRMVRSGELPGHIEKLRSEYRARRDAMLAALREHFPAEARWTHPRGGLFVWVELPEGVNCGDFMRAAVDRGVLFPPGAGFHRDGTGRNTMRLNFSNQPPDRIREGVKRLGEVVKEHLATMSS